MHKTTPDISPTDHPIKQWRQNKKLTQKELADKTGIPIASIQNWEQGKRKPSAEALKKIAAVVKCKIEDLI